MTLNDKIDQILTIFNDPIEFEKYGINKNYNAKLWNIDTSIFTILKVLNNKISEITEPILELEVKSVSINEKGNPMYSMYINNINITPASYNKKESAYSTIRQYLQILSSLGIVMFGDCKKNNIVNKFKITSNFKESISEFNNSETIKRLISFCLKRNIDYSRNIAFSLFITALNYFDYNFANLKSKNKIITKRANKDGTKFFDLNSDYGIKYIDKCYKETYRQLIIECLKNENLENFINDLYNICFEKDDNNIEFQIDIKNYLSELNKKKSLFKRNIKDNRTELKLLNENNDNYSDILNINNEIDRLCSKFNELHAAHIYNFWQIKSEILKIANLKKDNYTNILKNIMDWASDPYNGLVMKSEYHDYFDRNLFSFNNNGEMIYREEDKEYLFNVLRLEEIKINPLILNDKMKNFLRLRKF